MDNLVSQPINANKRDVDLIERHFIASSARPPDGVRQMPLVIWTMKHIWVLGQMDRLQLRHPSRARRAIDWLYNHDRTVRLQSITVLFCVLLVVLIDTLVRCWP